MLQNNMDEPSNLSGDPVLSAVLESAVAKPRTRHSPVYKWLLDNYTALAPTLNKSGIDWSSMAEKLTALGIMDGTGGAVRPRTLQQTWRKVVRRKTGRKRRAVKRSVKTERRVALSADFRAALPGEEERS
jgi:hypothetical protein